MHIKSAMRLPTSPVDKAQSVVRAKQSCVRMCVHVRTYVFHTCVCVCVCVVFHNTYATLPTQPLPYYALELRPIALHAFRITFEYGAKRFRAEGSGFRVYGLWFRV